MIKQLILGFIIFCTLTNCSENQEQTKLTGNKITEESDSFNSDYDTLDKMQIPISLTPESWGEIVIKHFKKYGIIEGWKLLKHPYAKLVDSKNYKAVIFIAPIETGAPTLVTLDKQGNPIDTLFLLGDWGNNDPSIGTNEIATINKDLSIHLLDSTSTFDLDLNGDRIDSTRKLTIKDEIYKITDFGKIEKIN